MVVYIKKPLDGLAGLHHNEPIKSEPGAADMTQAKFEPTSHNSLTGFMQSLKLANNGYLLAEYLSPGELRQAEKCVLRGAVVKHTNADGVVMFLTTDAAKLYNLK